MVWFNFIIISFTRRKHSSDQCTLFNFHCTELANKKLGNCKFYVKENVCDVWKLESLSKEDPL